MEIIIKTSYFNASLKVKTPKLFQDVFIREYSTIVPLMSVLTYFSVTPLQESRRCGSSPAKEVPYALNLYA